MESTILIFESVCYLCDLAVNVRHAFKNRLAVGVVFCQHLDAIALRALPYRRVLCWLRYYPFSPTAQCLLNSYFLHITMWLRRCKYSVTGVQTM